MPSNRGNRSGAAPADPTKFQQAIEAFRRRDPITDDELDALTELERERAFWVAGVSEADLVQEVFDQIDRAIVDGTDLAEFKKVVSEKLADAWGAEDAARVENIFRTNILDAYNDGRHEVMTDPIVLQARPYWRCDRMHGGSKHGDKCICGKMDGIVRPADDPLWQVAHPIFHHGCGCHLTPMSRAEVLREGGVSRVPELGDGPAKGFGKPPAGPVEEDRWVPDVAAYSPEIGAIVKRKLGL